MFFSLQPALPPIANATSPQVFFLQTNPEAEACLSLRRSRVRCCWPHRVLLAAGSGGRHALLSVPWAPGFAVEMEIDALPSQSPRARAGARARAWARGRARARARARARLQVRWARLLRPHRGRCLAAAHAPLHVCKKLPRRRACTLGSGLRHCIHGAKKGEAGRAEDGWAIV